jgi:hypothetical protein
MRKYNIINCGRRFGKTAMAMSRLLGPMLDGFPCGWFAPNYKYLAQAWRDIVQILKPVTRHRNKSEKRIELLTGGSLEFWTLEDPDSGRSRKYRRVVVDEAAKARHLEEAWCNSILATLGDLEGDADVYSTPKGHNYFFTLAAIARDRHNPEWSYHHFPTSANPHISPAVIEGWKKVMPERTFAQEILATFLDDAGGVFRNVAAAVDEGRRANDRPAPAAIYSGGADLARKEDFTVVDMLHPSGRQAFHERFNQISWTRQVEAISAASRLFNRAPVVLDTTGLGDPIWEALRKADMGPVRPFQFNSGSKEQLIENLAIQIEQGKLRLMDVPEQTAELLAFEYEITKTGRVTMQAPDGLHDDCVIALALAAWGMRSTTQKRGFL